MGRADHPVLQPDGFGFDSGTCWSACGISLNTALKHSYKRATVCVLRVQEEGLGGTGGREGGGR